MSRYKVKSQDISIPHLGYTVRVRDINRYKGEKPNKALAFVEPTGFNSCTIHLNLLKVVTPGCLAHELIHVLQFMCIDRNMDFVRETEHMAYLIHYLMGVILGYEWDIKE